MSDRKPEVPRRGSIRVGAPFAKARVIAGLVLLAVAIGLMIWRAVSNGAG